MQSKPPFYTVADLRARGWNVRLISRFLGRPDSFSNPAVRDGRHLHLYCSGRVELVELCDPGFADAREKALVYAARGDAAKKEMKDRLIDVVRSIHFPPLELCFEEIINQRADAVNCSDVSANHRLAVQTLVDTMKSLESPLNLYGRYSGVCDARVFHRNRVLDHILQGYPQLELAVQHKRRLLNESRGLNW